MSANVQVKLLKQADRTLELLEVDEAKYADELGQQQLEFASSLNTLTTVCAVTRPSAAGSAFPPCAWQPENVGCTRSLQGVQRPQPLVCTWLCVAQALMAVQNQHDMAKVAEIAAQVSVLDGQLRAASKEAAQINTREGLLGRPITDYSQVKQLLDMFDPFQQFWTTSASWKVGLSRHAQRQHMHMHMPCVRLTRCALWFDSTAKSAKVQSSIDTANTLVPGGVMNCLQRCTTLYHAGQPQSVAV